MSDPETQYEIPDGTPICRMTEDDLANVGIQCRWPGKAGQATEVTLFHAVSLPTLTPDAVDRVFSRVCAAWTAVANLTLRVVADRQGAMIVSSASRIDGPMGILGQSELPCGANHNTQLTQNFDASERWDETMFFQTVLHEVGHSLGLEHAPLGTGAVMEPILNRSITSPMPWDIAQIQARYGPPAVQPTNPTTPPPDPGKPLGLTLNVPAAGNYVIEVWVGSQKIAKPLALPAGALPVRVVATRR